MAKNAGKDFLTKATPAKLAISGGFGLLVQHMPIGLVQEMPAAVLKLDVDGGPVLQIEIQQVVVEALAVQVED